MEENIDSRDENKSTILFLQKKLDDVYEEMKKYPASSSILYADLIRKIKEEYGYKDVLRNGLGKHMII